MCGIAGFYGTPDLSRPREALLRRMIGAIGHRGPDAEGVLTDRNVGLAHARLSIIDLAGGAQPMSNADGTIHVTFSGKIFNYVELRNELIARGHRFATSSDTEVILHLYQERGADCVTAFNGDFAFAIFDRRNNRLVLARDRMGVRPLFHTTRGGCLYFASEVKALLEAPGVTAAMDPLALDQIFTFWFPLAPRTPFKDIFELPPAHVLVAEGDNVTIRPYWRLDYPDAADSAAIDRRGEAAIADELCALLLDATRIRLRSDVPVGAYLSGGLDSSIVTAAVKSIKPDRLRTFSVTFELAEFDESAYQRDLVRALGTEHSAVACSVSDIGRDFPTVIRHAERPILRTAPTALLRLSALARESGTKVVLTGEGADEVFAGCDIFKESKIRRFCAVQPQSKWRPLLLKRLYSYLPQLKSQSQPYLEAFFGTSAEGVQDPLFSHLLRFRTTAGAKLFFSGDLRRTLKGYDALEDLRSHLPADFARWHPLSQAQYLEAAHLLPGYILSSQGDRVAMANAIEGRFPFLDHRVVELAARIPPHLKMRGLREKHILREATTSLLPAHIGDRTKQPCRAPDCQSFTGFGAPAYVGHRLSGPDIAAAGYFDASAVGKLANKCRSQKLIGFRDNMAFVGVLSTQLWHREFVQGATIASDIPYAVA